MKNSVFRSSKSPESAIQYYVDAEIISEVDAEILRGYLGHIQVTRGMISQNSLTRYITNLCTLQKIDPAVGISELTTDIIYEKVRNIHSSEKYTQNTKSTMLVNGKAFWRYLGEHKLAKIDLKGIKKIKNIPLNFQTTAPDEILTPAEILSMISHAGSARNRAIVAVLYESAGRISEVANLRWRDVVFDAYGAGVHLPDYKTHQIRYARLIIAAPHLLEWRNQYERMQPATGENMIFITNRQTPLLYARYHQMLREVAASAGITKRVHPHLLRKSRITHLTQDGYSESIIKKLAWGNQNTMMMRTYSVLSEKDIDGEFLQRSGLQDADAAETDEILHPTRCIRCGAVMAPDQRYCGRCGLSKDSDLIDPNLSVDPELIARVLKILQEQNK